ncbi:MAG: hypothetical protein K6U00_01785 [Armatimonadetes bacterium]|nr:hypothetical protein [Armatimonadota bacterium]
MNRIHAEFGDPIRCPGSHGDLWSATWADDDALYCVSDDTRGFFGSCDSNLAVHRLDGVPPHLHGYTINPMSEYGRLGETLTEDGGMWKACGLTCIDGVLYLSVSRHIGNEMHYSRYGIQEAWDSSIVFSYDHGKSWSQMPSLGKAMFPGHAFATPFFIQYGKNGYGYVHGADAYIYAISSKGVWNNGMGMTLGRVRRERIERLDPADWEFVQGFDIDGNPIWGKRHDVARQVFYAPGRSSMTGVHYFEPLGIYIMPQWYYTNLEDPARRWKSTCIELWWAYTPWGPWELFHRQRFEPEAWYNPCIPAKFISEDGLRFTMFVAGDWTTCDDPEGYYSLFMIPVTLSIQT